MLAGPEKKDQTGKWKEEENCTQKEKKLFLEEREMYLEKESREDDKEEEEIRARMRPQEK